MPHARSVFIRIGRLLSCVFIFSVAGGHWGLMQTAAWSTMAVESDSGSFIGAILSAPCERCLAILEGSQHEKDDPQSAANAKEFLIAGSTVRRLVFYSPEVAFELDTGSAMLSGIRPVPAHGPPRGC